MKIVLASKSPRRKEILENLGFRFEVIVSNADEICSIADPAEYVMEIATRKGKEVAKRNAEDILVISCDTVVVVDGQVIGKPLDREDAVKMLKMLSGRSHTVVSGLSLFLNGKSLVDFDSTEVTFAKMPDDFIEYYVSTGDPLDKAGAYAVQGLTSLYIERINGCYFNVVGLPVNLLQKMLLRLGINTVDLIV